MTIAPAATPTPTPHVHDGCGCETGHCAPPKPLERNRFYARKLMEVRHWKAEQAYHRHSRQLVSRLSTGSGVLCGLEVTLTDVGTLVITAGVATDGFGRLVIVPEDLEVDPSRLSGPHVKPGSEPVKEGVVTVSVSYRECDTDLVAIRSKSCGDEVQMVASMTCESYCITVTSGATDRVDLSDGVCEALGGCSHDEGPDEGEDTDDLDAEARRALLDRLAPRSCACAEECVPLATVTFTEGGPALNTSVRTVIRSNRELLDLILCLADRLDECCHTAPAPVVTAPRITGLWPLPDAEGTALTEFRKTRQLEIAFDQDMAEQGLDAPDSWLGVWLLPKPALTHVVQAARLVVKRSGNPLAHVVAPTGGDVAVYDVDLPTLKAGDQVVVMVRSTVAGVIRATGAGGLALDAEFAATSLTAAQRDALWAIDPGQTIARPAVGSAPLPPLPSGDGTAGGDLHILLGLPEKVELPPRLLAVDPVGGVASDADWNKLLEGTVFTIVVSRALAQAALDSPREWLRLWYAYLDGDRAYGATEVETRFFSAEEQADGSVRYSFGFGNGLPPFANTLVVLWQLRSTLGSPLGAAAPELLLDADFKGTELDTQTLIGIWSGAVQDFPFPKPVSTAGQQLWDDTAGGLAHWGLTAQPF